MAIMHRVLAATFIYTAQISLLSAAETLSVNTTSSAPLATPQQNGYLDLIAIESFKRIGRNIAIQFLPGERSLINLNQGIDDATIVRISGLENIYPNIRIVPEKIMDLKFVAFTVDPNAKVKEWADLKSYRVAHIIGWKIYERNTQDIENVTKVESSLQLFNLLVLGRVDVILSAKWEGLNIVRERGLTRVRELSPPLATKEMFMYVNKKHEALVDKLAAAIRSMKADGTFESIYQRTLVPLLEKE